MLIASLATLLSFSIGSVRADGDDAPIGATCHAGNDGSEELDPCSGSGEATDPGSAPQGNRPQSTVGNPISLFDGSKHQRETDHSIAGSELVFNRTYDSANADFNVGLGQGWHHSYSVSLFDAGNGSREIVQSDGSRLRFDPDGRDADGHVILRGAASNEGHLLVVDDEHHWHLPDGRRLRFRGSFLVEIDWPDQRRLSLKYHQQKLASVTDETGRVLRLRYTAGRRGLDGFESTRYRAQPGTLESVTLPDGRVIGYDYDERKNLTRVRYPDGTAREYHYENASWPNHLTGLTERTGERFASWTYDDEGRAVTSEHAGGTERVTLDYPDSRAVAAGETVETGVTNSLGERSVYTWRSSEGGDDPRLLSSSGPGCATCPPTGIDYTYDAAGRLTSTRPTGQGTAVDRGRIDYRYDDQGRLAEVTRTVPSGETRLVARYAYDGVELLASRVVRPSVNPDGEQVVETERDEAGRVTATTHRGWAPADGATDGGQGADQGRDQGVGSFRPIERITRQTYENGRLASIDGPRDDVADVMTFEWDERNRPVSIRTPDAPVLRLTGFDALGRVTGFRQGDQSPVSLEYGEEDRVVRVEQRGRAIRFGYDAEGRLLRFTSPDGATSYLEYDAAGHLATITDAHGRRTTFETDSEGRRRGSAELGRDGTLIRSVDTLFDALGRVASTRTETVAANGNPVTTTLERTYDETGRLDTVADAATGRRVDIGYDVFGALASVSEPASGDAAGPDGESLTRFEHDAAGREIALTDARDNRTEYLKDDFGRVVRHTSADTGVTRYEYDAANNRVARHDADGNTVRYTWDAANRLLSKRRPDGLFTYAYDPAHGQLVESVAPGTTERFAFDAEARLVRHEREIDGRLFATGYRYDENGRLSHKTLPDGQSLHYHYRDEAEGVARGTLRAITRDGLFGLMQETLVGEIDQDATDGTTGHSAGNGLRTIGNHAPDGSLRSLEIDRTMALAYTFDDAGRIVGIDANGTLQRYAYSEQGLSAAWTDDGLYRFDYDAAGNRTGQSLERPDGTAEATAYTYPAPGGGNRQVGGTTLDGLLDGDEPAAETITSSEFTAGGAPLTARAGLRYEYDDDRRPVRVFDDGTLLAEYAYNGFGERIRKVVYRGDRKRVTYFLYDGHQLSAEIDADSGEMRHGVFLGEALVTYLIGHDAYAVHGDHLGTPRMATDEAGDIVWSADYAPFGRATTTVAGIDLPYRFPGQYEDEETGTHYNYYRDYDPASGRYVTADPIGLQGGLNTYAYALNDPLGLTDVLGLAPGDDASAASSGTPEKPSAETEQSYADKLTEVFTYAIEDLKETDPEAAAVKFLEDMVANIAVVAAIVAVVAAAHVVGGPVAATVDLLLATAGWLFAGYEAGKFLVSTIMLGIELDGTELCDEAALREMGGRLSDSVKGLSEALAESVLLGALSKLGRVVDRVGEFAEDGAWAIWRKLRRDFNDDATLPGRCSFAGDTLVSTRDGYRPIRDIEAGKDEVWARDELTGRSGWRDVLAQYHNRYDATVKVTARDADGHRQTITSNRIHPYFARIAASALIATSTTAAIASEGHIYRGEIAGGAWVDAQYLEVGDELLSDRSDWQTIESVELEVVPLDAYNLTVDEYSTYFVAGNSDAPAVWVHNNCYDRADLPERYRPTEDFTDYDQPIFRDSNGNEVYEGHDGRFYDPTVPGQEPTSNGVDGPRRSPSDYDNQFPSDPNAVYNYAAQTQGSNATGANLSRNMERVGFTKPPNSTAHHIVASNDGRFPDAATARELINEISPPFDINEAANGVFLPRNRHFPDEVAPNHLSIHSGPYYAELVARLRAVQPSERRAVLRRIARELVNNTFPW